MKFRKSVKAGPFRMTFSNSGISTSVGVKGARLTSSNRGTHVTIGGNGVYYRKKISTSNQKNKNQFNQQEIISSKLDVIETVDSDLTTDEVYKDFIDEIQKKVKRPMYSTFFLIASIAAISFLSVSTEAKNGLLLVAVILFMFLRSRDKKAKEVNVSYEFEDGDRTKYDKFLSKMTEYKSSQMIWRIVASKQTSDYKNNAGASSLVNRVPIKVNSKNSFVKSNVEIFNMKVGKEQIVFLPDRALFIEKKKVGALAYSEISTNSNTTRFIEESRVPRDSSQVDSTWKFVNKNGSPDKRYKGNRQLPVMEYGQVRIKSSTGVNYLFMTSNVNASEGLHQALNID